MSVTDLLFGKPLRSSEESDEKLGVAPGISVFGLDALSSAAYGPEAALALLISLGAVGLGYIVPITASICLLLLIVYFSYRQTIEAYPKGGGSYTVAGENLGPFAGLLAAAALMIDYVLTAAVGISAGVGALVSAVPSLQPHTLIICLAILLAMALVNLRGSRETGLVFMLPTYLFVGTLGITLIVGLAKSLAAGGHPLAATPPAPLHTAAGAIGIWLLLKAFSSGCTAMTGVEAVSNGVSAFREPVIKTAQRTLTTIIAILIVLLAGIAYLCRAYNVGAMDAGPGYQSVLSELTAAVFGKDLFYFVTMGSVLLVLSFSANTAFADFPRLCRLIAEDGYLPTPLAIRGRRLVYTWGITALTLLCALLLILFGGVTDRLIPLFAVGAFLAFTMSQAGMVVHWMKHKGPGSGTAMIVNGLGATATACTVVVITVAKFVAGAWITALLIPCIMIVMYAIRRHYNRVVRDIACAEPLDFRNLQAPLVVLPVFAWNQVVRSGVQFALNLSSELHVVHVESEESGGSDRVFEKEWCKFVENPMLEAGMAAPRLVILKSPYRFVINPIVDYVLNLQKQVPDRRIAVIIPELVEKHWYFYFLHNQRAATLKTTLYVKGQKGIVVINVPWYLDEDGGISNSV